MSHDKSEPEAVRSGLEGDSNEHRLVRMKELADRMLMFGEVEDGDSLALCVQAFAAKHQAEHDQREAARAGMPEVVQSWAAWLHASKRRSVTQDDVEGLARALVEAHDTTRFVAGEGDRALAAVNAELAAVKAERDRWKLAYASLDTEASR